MPCRVKTDLSPKTGRMLDMAEETMLYTECKRRWIQIGKLFACAGWARAVEVRVRKHDQAYPCVSLTQFRAGTRGTQGTDCPSLAGRTLCFQQRGRRR